MSELLICYRFYYSPVYQLSQLQKIDSYIEVVQYNANVLYINHCKQPESYTFSYRYPKSLQKFDNKKQSEEKKIKNHGKGTGFFFPEEIWD